MMLVTGGAGFIGSHLARTLLDGGHRVIVLDNLSRSRGELLPSDVEFVKGDIRDDELIDRLMVEVECCFHLAAIASVQLCETEALEAVLVNEGGSLTIFEAALKAHHKPPVVYASSAAVYGNTGSSKNITENTELCPLGVYGRTKLHTEFWAKQLGPKGLKTVGLRYFNVYGYPFNMSSQEGTVVQNFIQAVAKGNPLMLYGGGKQVRDLISVNDVAQLTIKLSQYATEEAPVVNICTGQGTLIAELAKLVKRFFPNSTSQVQEAPPLLNDIGHSIGSTAALLKLLPDFSPKSLAQELEAIASQLAL